MHPFLFLVLLCGMEGFVHGKAIPNIKKLIEKLFGDMRREVNPFPKACNITRGRQQCPRARLKAPADSQQSIGWPRMVQANPSSQSPGREKSLSKKEWPPKRDTQKLVHPRVSHQNGKNVGSEPSLPSSEKYHFFSNLVLTYKRHTDAQILGA